MHATRPQQAEQVQGRPALLHVLASAHQLRVGEERAGRANAEEPSPQVSAASPKCPRAGRQSVDYRLMPPWSVGTSRGTKP